MKSFKEIGDVVQNGLGGLRETASQEQFSGKVKQSWK